jgi:hypothetical protein
VGARALYPPAERSQIQESWDTLMRWSKSFSKQRKAAFNPIEAADKVVVFGGGSFGTAMGTSLAHKKADLDVVLLLRDPYLCHDINSKHINSKYLAVRHTGPCATHMQDCVTFAFLLGHIALTAGRVLGGRLVSCINLSLATRQQQCVSTGLPSGASSGGRWLRCT